MIYMFLSNNPSSGDINSSNLPCFLTLHFEHTFWRLKVPSHREGSFEYPQHMLRSRNNEIIFTLFNRFTDPYLDF